jgi:glycosyltransferase involved in cell wall biosynthesis
MTDDDRRIKIVEVLEATTGGTRRHLYDLVTRLDRTKFDVSVVCSTLRDPAFLGDVQKIRDLGIDVIEIPMRRAISPLRDLIALWRLRSYLLSHKPSVVHTHSSKAGFLGRIAAKLAKVELIVHSPHVFSFEMGVNRLLQALFFRLEKFAARLTDVMVCVSSSEKDAVVRHRFVSPENCIVVKNGVDVTSLEAYERDRIQRRQELGLADEVVIGSIGRFTRQKGPEYFLAAAKQVAGQLPDAKCVLIGDGELKGEIEGLIEKHDLHSHCVIVDVGDEFPSYYPVFDIFVLTSLWEGMPYAMLEAMAAGRAVVAFSTGGIVDVISDGVNGMLVEPKNIEELASTLCTLGKDPQKRKDLGMAAKELIAGSYTVEAMVRQIEQVYMRERLT